MKLLKINKADLISTTNPDDWQTAEEFWKLLKKERNRSDRTGLPFSYVQIRISQTAIQENNVSNRSYQRFLRKFTGLISQNTRDFDLKFFVDPFTIGILLIDTSADGAKAFIQKLSDATVQHFDSMRKHHYLAIIQSIVLSSHPPNQIPNGKIVPEAAPTSITSLKYHRPLPAKSNMTLSLLESDFSSHEYEMSASPGVITLHDPLLWGLAYEYHTRISHRIKKRFVDISASLFFMIFLSPLMLLIAIMIKLTSEGPVFFKQKRIGHLHKPFTLYKFRTMKQNGDDRIHQEYVKKYINGDAESMHQSGEGKPHYKMSKDPRVTWLGHYLRKSSFDEIPQFFNVLKGDMSVVGPRPPLSYEVEDYQSWHLRRILDAKPGITGLWQVSGRNSTTFEEMVRLDLQYAQSKSILLDIKIMLHTFKVIFKNRDAS